MSTSFIVSHTSSEDTFGNCKDEWKVMSARVSTLYPQLCASFVQVIENIESSSRAATRIDQLKDLVGANDENGATASALLMLSVLHLNGLTGDWSQELEVDGVKSFFSKLSPFSRFEGNTFGTQIRSDVIALKDLIVQLVSNVNVQKLTHSYWTSSIHNLWLSILKSNALSKFSELAGLLSMFVESLDSDRLNTFWKADSTRWYAMADEAKDKIDIAALLYSLELVIPVGQFSNPFAWEEERYEWLNALKRFPNESLAELKETIRLAYGLSLDEEGHATLGHKCITEKDKAIANADGSSFLFGEFLATGVHRAFDKEHLDGSNAKVVYDFGMGLGKLLLQVYLQFPNIEKLVGVELSPSRYQLGRDGMNRFYHQHSGQYTFVKTEEKITSIVDSASRLLEFREQNLFDAKEGLQADIIILETHFPKEVWDRLTGFIANMKSGSRLLTYENLFPIYEGKDMPFEQIPINAAPNDRFYTTWSPKRGHHFYLWRRK
jgi:hypothetical protein